MHDFVPHGAPLTLLHPQPELGLQGLAPTLVLAEYPGDNAAWEITVATEHPEPGCLAARATVTNTGSAPIRCHGLRWGGIPGYSDGAPLVFPRNLAPRYHSTQNFRGDYYGIGTTFGDRFFYPLGNQMVELGWSEDHLFPGLFIGAETAPLGLFAAQASQDRFYPLFRLKGPTSPTRWQFEIDELAVGVPWLELAPGGKLDGEKLFFAIVPTGDPQEATDAYYRLLRRDGKFARRDRNPLPAQRIYCSWNYDFFADITEADLLAQIPLVRHHFPSVRFMQLDDGYQHRHNPRQRAMIDLCYDLPEAWNRDAFPSGGKGLADRIRAGGLRPAIWLGLWASTASPMFADHPDWILRDNAGRRLIFERAYGGTFILDPSVPAVQDYLDRMARTVFQEWGFEGVKLDFSSFAFNCKRVLYRFPGRTAVEYRHLIESIFRRYLPDDGFFGWCVVAGTSQPFLSQADYFRNAIDIGHGSWELARLIANMTANTAVLLGEPTALPNIDSIGWSDRFDDTQWESWLTLCAVTGMAVELSGDLRKLSPARLARLARTLELSQPGRRLTCLDLPAGPIQRPPALWLATTPANALLAVINWDDQTAAIALDHPRLAPYAGPAAEAWTGAPLGPLPAAVELAPRSSRLFLLQP